MDVAGRGAERAQRGELVEVVLGARVERLRDDDDADDDAEQRAGDERGAGPGLEQPVVEAALAELGLVSTSVSGSRAMRSARTASASASGASRTSV